MGNRTPRYGDLTSPLSLVKKSEHSLNQTFHNKRESIGPPAIPGIYERPFGTLSKWGRETNSVSNIDLTSISGSRSLSLFLIIPYSTTLKRICQEESGPFSKYFRTLICHSLNSSKPSGDIRKPPSIQYSAYISLNSFESISMGIPISFINHPTS